ncbi:lysylphosphatidylglycerol synthase transmembrane domain-containing protein [Actinomadura parmotrematis]|uniref:YbhN family protein n=1 Tax=Actinomadura parmotrematis TaxID=2864039 RepID=A0ABS7FKN4_9ACTN|nr:YbhN family protein [Actinomadura parmotrematis]MBW8480911.1 YbhN family protein [Actinomadura parmotrematis]
MDLTAGAGRPARGRASRRATAVRLALTALVIALTAALAVAERGTVASGVRSLARADPGWVAVAVAANLATFLAALAVQYGSMRAVPRPGRLLGVQLALCGVGLVPGAGGTVYVRFLRKQGLGAGEIVGAFLLMGLAGGIVRAGYLLALLPAAPAEWRRSAARWRDWRPPGAGDRLGAWTGPAALLAGLALLAAGAALMYWLARRNGAARLRTMSWTARERARTDVRAVRDVAAHPGRAACLWLGVAALTPLNALVLYAMLHGLGVGLGYGTTVAVYVLLITLAALVPAPNGVGSTEVVMTAGLVLGGVPAGPALGAALGYRLLTFWTLLPPGVAAFAWLSRRRAV